MAKGTMRPSKEKRKPKAEKNKKPKGPTPPPAIGSGAKSSGKN